MVALSQAGSQGPLATACWGSMAADLVGFGPVETSSRLEPGPEEASAGVGAVLGVASGLVAFVHLGPCA